MVKPVLSKEEEALAAEDTGSLADLGSLDEVTEKKLSKWDDDKVSAWLDEREGGAPDTRPYAPESPSVQRLNPYGRPVYSQVHPSAYDPNWRENEMARFSGMSGGMSGAPELRRPKSDYESAYEDAMGQLGVPPSGWRTQGPPPAPMGMAQTNRYRPPPMPAQQRPAPQSPQMPQIPRPGQDLDLVYPWQR